LDLIVPIATQLKSPTAMSEDNNSRPLSTGEWFLTLFILGIPLVGIVMYFVWAFGAGNVSRANFCRAGLIWLAIGITLAMLFMFAFGGLAMLAAAANP
jgi:hypothetical protein